ncbi:MAG: hypothetical protein NC177_05515 [Ruminococcus flavefaciens]|nr:hypothetical protein [Ruminococcus flavefaciens]
MGDFDKKKAWGIGGVLTGLAAVIAVLANLSQIVEGVRDFFDKPEKSVTTTSIVETVEKEPEETVVEQEDVIQAEENYAEVVEEVPPTEPQPTVVYLDSLKVAESNGFYENEVSAESTVGDKYIGHIMTIGHVGVCDSETEFGMFYLGGKYKILSGNIAINDTSWEGARGELSISCDDNVIYTTEEMGRATAPFPLPENLSVEGCQWLKISLVNYGGTWNAGWDKKTNVILADWKLE